MADGKYGHYEWQTYKQIWDATEQIAKGILDLNICPVQAHLTEDNRQWRFSAIWSKNRWEWNTVYFATQLIQCTIVGFYDSMGPDAVDYCFEQTSMPSLFCSKEYLAKILAMREQGLAKNLKDIVLFDKDEDYDANKEKCAKIGIKVYLLSEVIAAGKASQTQVSTDKLTKDDVTMLNYTSGTTGNPKGVKVHSFGTVMDVVSMSFSLKARQDDIFISYLPSPHVFDQVMFGSALLQGARVGYYHGDTLALTDDC